MCAQGRCDPCEKASPSGKMQRQARANLTGRYWNPIDRARIACGDLRTAHGDAQAALRVEIQARPEVETQLHGEATQEPEASAVLIVGEPGTLRAQRPDLGIRTRRQLRRAGQRIAGA